MITTFKWCLWGGSALTWILRKSRCFSNPPETAPKVCPGKAYTKWTPFLVPKDSSLPLYVLNFNSLILAPAWPEISRISSSLNYYGIIPSSTWKCFLWTPWRWPKGLNFSMLCPSMWCPLASAYLNTVPKMCSSVYWTIDNANKEYFQFP